MLTQEQRDEFARTGLLRVPGVLTEADAARVREDIWTYLGPEYGVEPADRNTWPAIRIPTFKGLRRSEAFDRIGDGPVPAVLDDLLGPRWQLPTEWARNPMVTFPMPGTTWDVPADGWPRRGATK